jgi:nitrate/TMAO reductase-like tetraheme cytochrome c subunit
MGEGRWRRWIEKNGDLNVAFQEEGIAMSNGFRIRMGVSTVALFLFVLCGWPNGRTRAGDKVYVGSQACVDCHDVEYENFKAYAKKAHSYESIEAMKKGLTETEFRECFQCHTTGYKKPGGFRSEHETPQLKNAGCEVCHGPGSLHCETEDPYDIKGRLTARDCEACHNSDRVENFDYKPLIYGGAH